ncbi:unnamed protein product [Protopolystoma xenopodis]|uniref:Uncharacterized protein n=1 Tax=Protopolystoma xenopodis TaxID=117903 RepID=A0A3S5B4S5_9PLAT|nr:unnamed protein product [Protopolystoma xenopodis]
MLLDTINPPPPPDSGRRLHCGTCLNQAGNCDSNQSTVVRACDMICSDRHEHMSVHLADLSRRSIRPSTSVLTPRFTCPPVRRGTERANTESCNLAGRASAQVARVCEPISSGFRHLFPLFPLFSLSPMHKPHCVISVSSRSVVHPVLAQLTNVIHPPEATMTLGQWSLMIAFAGALICRVEVAGISVHLNVLLPDASCTSAAFDLAASLSQAVNLSLTTSVNLQSGDISLNSIPIVGSCELTRQAVSQLVQVVTDALQTAASSTSPQAYVVFVGPTAGAHCSIFPFLVNAFQGQNAGLAANRYVYQIGWRCPYRQTVGYSSVLESRALGQMADLDLLPSLYSTFDRLTFRPSAAQLTVSLFSLLHYFGWGSVFIVYERPSWRNDAEWELMAEYIVNRLAGLNAAGAWKQMSSISVVNVQSWQPKMNSTALLQNTTQTFKGE